MACVLTLQHNYRIIDCYGEYSKASIKKSGSFNYSEYSKVMVLVFKYSLRASLPRSFPNPDSLNPPNGVATSVLLYTLTKQVPASRCSLTKSALLTSLVNTPEASPYSVLLALFTTPSTSPASNLEMHMMGPKLSSLARNMSSSTSQKMVGSMNRPGRSSLFPPRTSLAPSLTPVSQNSTSLFM